MPGDLILLLVIATASCAFGWIACYRSHLVKRSRVWFEAWEQGRRFGAAGRHHHGEEGAEQ